MPRTKRPVKKQEKTTETDDALKKLNRLVADQKKKIDFRTQLEIRNVELAFKILIGDISSSLLTKTISQLKEESQTDFSKRTPQSCSASQDDGYLTENSSHGSGERGKKHLRPPTSVVRTTTRRSRSADASSRKPAAPRRSRSVYRTPAYNKNAPLNYPAITPKVAPHTPLTVLRQPRQGEMVVSMSGSPVMVPTCYNMRSDEKANCNILLQDGTMLSLQPKQLRQSQAYIPFSLMDSNVLHQLKTLKENLEKVVTLGEKEIHK